MFYHVLTRACNDEIISLSSDQGTLYLADKPKITHKTIALKDNIKSDLDTIRGHSPKIEARKSPVHGYGIFAKETIEAGELIEECRLLKFGHRGNYNNDPILRDYAWGGKNDGEQTRLHGPTQYIALGFGSLYNHSDQPNTTQKLDFNTEIMTIKARQLIIKDEELFLSYGKKYFMIRDFWRNISKNDGAEGHNI